MKRFAGFVVLIVLLLGAAVGWLAYGAEKEKTRGEPWAVRMELSAQELQMQENLALWYNLKLADSGDGKSGEGYEEILFLEDGIMCSIEFPQVRMELPVWHGARGKQPVGLTHLAGTALPMGGKGNHTVLVCREEGICAMALPQKGDRFVVHILGNTIAYRVCDADATGRKPNVPKGEPEKDLCSIWIRRERDWVIVRGTREQP